jgi:hypothetical protein
MRDACPQTDRIELHTLVIILLADVNDGSIHAGDDPVFWPVL